MPRNRKHKLVSAREEKFTPNAIRQQQLAWLIYITEGYLANLRHALTVNNFCMYTDDIQAVKDLAGNVEDDLAHLRSTFFPE